jgi:hypothetical protein
MRVNPTALKLFSFAARGLVLTAVCRVSMLLIWVEDSLAHRAGDGIWTWTDEMAWIALCMSVFGWLDLIANDMLGVRTWINWIPHKLLHSLCTMYWALYAGWFGILAYVALTPDVAGNAVLVWAYIMLAGFTMTTAVAVAIDER